MEKVIHLLWGDGGDELRDQLLALAPSLADAGAEHVAVNVHDAAAAEAPSPAPAPEGEVRHVAEVSTWLRCYQDCLPITQRIADVGLTYSGYLVVESLYDDYGTTAHAGPRDWPAGTRSPGVLTVALIHRPRGLDYLEWIDRWHNVQSPESARLQPRTRYVRNEVVRAITPFAREVHGIVEEAWPSAQHVADPMLFFNADGDPDTMNANIGTMMDNVVACLDLSRLRSTTMSEYLDVV